MCRTLCGWWGGGEREREGARTVNKQHSFASLNGIVKGLAYPYQYIVELLITPSYGLLRLQ